MLRLRHLRVFSVLLLLGAACAPAAPPEAPAPVVDAHALAEVAESRITADLAFDHISTLAADEMRGRDTPSPELERAAEYLATRFDALGLEPAGDDGSYIQRWTLERRVLDAGESDARGRAEGVDRSWRYGDEYFVIPSPERRVEGSPVYVGDPLSAAEGLPEEAVGRPLMVSLPEGLGPAVGMAIQAAMQAQSPGIVLIMDEESDAQDMHQIAAALEGGAAGELPLPVLGLRFDVGEELLHAAGVEPRGGRDPPVILDDVTLSFQSVFTTRTDDVPNVVGLVRGSDPELADTYVVVTAHFDHVGVGPPDEAGDSIFNGADDNASGTAALVKVASALSALTDPPARSVLFLAVSGEEKGLLGSAHYAQNPTVPAEGIVANLNMDMVGRNHPDTVHAIGEEYSTLGEVAHQVARERPELGLVVAPDPDPEEQAFLRSDHFSFVQQNIPSLMLTTWIHDDYHQPSDTPEKIDADKVARIAQMAFYFVHRIASDPVPPRWTEEGRDLLEDVLP